MNRIIISSLLLFFGLHALGQRPITVLSPKNEAVLPTTTPPVFEWKPASETGAKKNRYRFSLYEISKGASPAEFLKKPVFERENITETYYRYDGKPLDTTKAYIWEVSNEEGSRTGYHGFSWFPFTWCFLFTFEDNNRVCSNQPVTITVYSLMTGAGVVNYTCTGPGNTTFSGTWNGFITSFTIPANQIPVNPGVYNYTLTATHGTCSRSIPLQIQVYDPVSAGTQTIVTPPDICDGETATITVPGKSNGVNIKWEFRDNCHPNWTPTSSLASTPSGMQGSPAGTNEQQTCSCTGAPWFTTREFRAHVGSDDPNAPACASAYTQTGVLKIYCKPSLSITVSPSAAICNNNMPVTFTLTANAVGNVTWSPVPGFTIVPSGPGTWTATGLPPSSGNITFQATASTGGPCGSVSQSVIIEVDQPVSCTGGITTNRDPLRIVCPPDDAILSLANCQNAGIVEWAYRKSTTAAWIPFGGNGTTQNTNNGSLNINVHTWYRATVHSKLDICPPVDYYTDIDVYPAPTPAIISPVGLITVCEGASSPLLTATTAAGNFTHIWMHNGVPATPPTVWRATDAGSWWMVTKDNCGRSVISKILTVKVDVITISVGPCCGTNPASLYIVSANSSLTGNFIPTPTNIQWRMGTCNGALVSTGLQVPNPIAGQTYCVRVRRSPNDCWSVCRCFTVPAICQ